MMVGFAFAVVNLLAFYAIYTSYFHCIHDEFIPES
jgi:hypothetical protein